MADLQTIERNALVATLNLNSEVITLVDERIVWEVMLEPSKELQLPYIKLINLAGGYENTTSVQAADSIWRVLGVTNKHLQAQELADAIHDALHRQYPVVDGVNVKHYSWITQERPIFESYKVQNVFYLDVGGIYRIRLIVN